MRTLYGSISDWGELYRQAFRALQPGGWLEDFEINIHLHSDVPEVRDDPEHIFKRWAKVFWEGADRIHRTLRIANNGTMRKLILEAGFTGVVEHTYQVPVGSWTQEVAVIGRGCVSYAAGRPLWAVTSGQNVAIGLTLYGGQLSSNEDETVWP